MTKSSRKKGPNFYKLFISNSHFDYVLKVSFQTFVQPFRKTYIGNLKYIKILIHLMLPTNNNSQD